MKALKWEYAGGRKVKLEAGWILIYVGCGVVSRWIQCVVWPNKL